MPLDGRSFDRSLLGGQGFAWRNLNGRRSAARSQDGLAFEDHSLTRRAEDGMDAFLTSRHDYLVPLARPRRPSRKKSVFGSKNMEWQGFFIALTGALGVILGLAALALPVLG